VAQFAHLSGRRTSPRLAPSREGSITMPPRPSLLLATTRSVLQLQAAAGNAAVRGLIGRVQRDIAVEGEDYPTLTVGSLANKYCTDNKGADWGRVRSALGMIEKTGEAFKSRALVYERVVEVLDAQKSRAVQPIWREPLSTRVAIELDYYFDKVDPKPKMTFVETYETKWDKTGGWGAEYEPNTEEHHPHWVIHVHRGPNGGLKAARVKPYDERKLPEKGFPLSKFDNLVALGIGQIDTKTTH
jgi:hypothetical protein